jgi:hypothetical protein
MFIIGGEMRLPGLPGSLLDTDCTNSHEFSPQVHYTDHQIDKSEGFKLVSLFLKRPPLF